jgi:hypothetical protein
MVARSTQHPILYHGLFWHLLDLYRNVKTEFLCEVGIRKCSTICQGYRSLQRAIEEANT